MIKNIYSSGAVGFGNPEDGQWSPWTSWSACNTSCHMTHTRTCTNPAPMFGGATCLGNALETSTCPPVDCPRMILFLFFLFIEDRRYK